MASNTAEANAASTAERGARHVEEGIVISDVRKKTITVEIKRLFKHSRYGKYIYRSTNLHAHDEKNEAKQGDRVQVVETRPISKQKRWRLLKVVERAAVLGSLDIKEVEIAPKKETPPPPVQAEGEPAKAEG